jgi:S-adenosylmethionine-diacylgycerolhomoserine-N-methlytransferase
VSSRRLSGAASDATDAGVRMDRIYRNQRHIYDLSRRFFLLGRKRLIEHLDVPAGGSVLEIGCGTAWNLVGVARGYPSAHMFGLDVSSEMLTTARKSIARQGLSDRITVAEADATNFSPSGLFDRACFDRVIASYTLSMIPNWRGAIEMAARSVAPGGSLHVVDFGQLEHYPGPMRNALAAWLGKFSVFPRRDLEVELAELAQRHKLAMTFERPYGGYAQHAILRRPA